VHDPNANLTGNPAAGGMRKLDTGPYRRTVRRSAQALQCTIDEGGNAFTSSVADAVCARAELCPAKARLTSWVNVASVPYSKPIRAGTALFATTFTPVCWIGPASEYVIVGALYDGFSCDHAT
jgi:hypothetical protein